MALLGFYGDIKYISDRLSSVKFDGDLSQLRQIMIQVIRLQGRGVDVRPLFPHVCKLLATPDLLVKKMVYWYISDQINHPDMLLCVNGLLKDCGDANPIIRAQALKTLTSLQDHEVTCHSVQPILNALKDQSAYVRRVAVTSCIKLLEKNEEAVIENGIIDKLYKMLRDTDPIVILNSLEALETLLQAEGGIVINKNIARHLLSKLHIFTDEGLNTVFKLLPKYRPKSEEHIIEIMNIVDRYLHHNSTNVVVCCLHYFMKLVENLPHLHSEVMNRVKGQIFTFLSSGNHELTSVLIDFFLEGLIEEHKEIFLNNVQSFFCKYNEPAHLKQKKLKVLSELVNDSNGKDIIPELVTCCNDRSPAVSEQAVAVLGNIATKHAKLRDNCLEKLLEILKSGHSSTCCKTLQTMRHINITDSIHFSHFVEILPSCVNYVNTDDELRSFITLLALYGEHIDEATYLIENIIDSVTDESDSSYILNLLSSTVILFLKRPAECQEMLGRLFEICYTCKDVVVREKLTFYYTLLQSPSDAINVVKGQFV